ncbi:MAG: fatty acid desaturase [Gemmataceae bacterium]
MSQTLSPAIDLTDRELLRRVAQLRRTNNWTGWLYLLREYLFLAIVIGLTVAWCEFLWFEGWSLAWGAPALFLCIVCVGAGQHRLATLTHEAAHYMLFKNRLLNELVSEWFCMFPILGTTHPYRVQHLGHHQYPNDPERDPDWTQMRLSGHRYRFPMSAGRFVWECCIKQALWWPSLLRYVAVRAFFKPNGPVGSPYHMKRRAAKAVVFFSLAYLAGLIGSLTYLAWNEETALLAWVPVGFLAVGLMFFLLVPDRWLTEYSIKSDIPTRWQNMMRLTFYTLLSATIAGLTVWTGRPVWFYFFLLWLVPLGTSFSFYMILRQIVQHGNADQARFTNTRVFHVHPLISMSVFPIGNDYHLPHHLFPMVPHYNLRKLHAMLMEAEEYRTGAILVEGYFFPPKEPREHPTVVDLMTR